MPITEIDLANDALSLLGHSPVASLTEATAGAAACARWLPRCRKEALTRHPWSFAVATATLVAADVGGVAVEDDEGRWAYAYAMPAGCLRAVLVNGDPSITWEVRGGVLYCDEEECVLRYLTDHATYDDWPASFLTYVGTLLAARVAMPITGSADIARAMQELSRTAYLSALRDDATGSRERPPSFRSLADSRF